MKRNIFNSLDKEAPTLNCPTNQTLENNSGEPTAVVVWPDLYASDNSGKNPSVTCSEDSGSKFLIGQNEIVCQAWDMNRNSATCTFTVDVIGKKRDRKLG